MSYYHWLGRDAEKAETDAMIERAYRATQHYARKHLENNQD